MLLSRWCDYSAANIVVKGTITSTGHGDDKVGNRADGRNKYVIFKKTTSFRERIIERNYA